MTDNVGSGLTIANLHPERERGAVIQRTSPGIGHDQVWGGITVGSSQSVDRTAIGAPEQTTLDLGGQLDRYVASPIDDLTRTEVESMLGFDPGVVGVPMTEEVRDQLMPGYGDIVREVDADTADVSPKEAGIPPDVDPDDIVFREIDVRFLGAVAREIDGQDVESPTVERFLSQTNRAGLDDEELGAAVLDMEHHGTVDNDPKTLFGQYDPGSVLRAVFDEFDPDTMSVAFGAKLLHRASGDDVDNEALAEILDSTRPARPLFGGMSAETLDRPGANTGSDRRFQATEIEAVSGPQPGKAGVDGPFALEVRSSHGSRSERHVVGAAPLDPDALERLVTTGSKTDPRATLAGVFAPLDGADRDFEAVIADRNARPDVLATTDRQHPVEQPAKRLRGYDPSIDGDAWMLTAGSPEILQDASEPKHIVRIDRGRGTGEDEGIGF